MLSLQNVCASVIHAARSHPVAVIGDQYTAVMVTDPEAEDEDPRGGPRVAFQIASSSIIQPAKTSSWQWGLAFVLGVLTIATAFQLGLVANVSMLPKVLFLPSAFKRQRLARAIDQHAWYGLICRSWWQNVDKLVWHRKSSTLFNSQTA